MEPRSRSPVGDLEAEKRELRRRMLSRRAAVSHERAREVGDRIAAHVVETDEFRGARTVALYAATGGEPDLRGLLDRGAFAGKRMLLPRCEQDGRLAFCEVHSGSELVRGRYQLLEPPPAAPRVECRSIDFVLVPSVAVDARGVRLGRGGGWYDRSFPPRAAGGPILVAAIHDFQHVEQVPGDAWDRAVDGFVSERGLTWTRGGASVVASERRDSDSRRR
jgi:5-formyltetrahydrofolate cyclo-ligase